MKVPSSRRRLTRRHVLRTGAAALGAGTITKRYTLDQSRQAVQDTADRTIITGVIEFT